MAYLGRIAAQANQLESALEWFSKAVGMVDTKDDAEIHFEFGCFFVKNQARLIVREGVLLPVDEVLGFDCERIRDDVAAAMGGRPKPNDLGAQFYQPVIAVVGNMVKCSMDRHASIKAKHEPMNALQFGALKFLLPLTIRGACKLLVPLPS